jgi:serine protease Do
MITRLDELPIHHRVELVENIRRRSPGDVVQLSITRDGQPQVIAVTLSHPFGTFLSQFAQQIRMGGELSLRRDGFDAVFAHDTVLRPTDCGGPLLDLTGRAVGLNIARSARTETLALPADVVQASLQQLLADAGRGPPAEQPGSESAAAEDTAASGDNGDPADAAPGATPDRGS